MLVESGMEGRQSDRPNVTESFAVDGTGRPMGYQRTGWEQSAALITAVPARAPARSAGVGRPSHCCNRASGALLQHQPRLLLGCAREDFDEFRQGDAVLEVFEQGSHRNAGPFSPDPKGFAEIRKPLPAGARLVHQSGA